MKNIGMLAGEPSGDILGANLITAMRRSNSDLMFSGVGGPRMIAEGFQSLYEMERLSVMGFIDPLLRLPELLRIRRGVYQHFLQSKPDVFVGIDSPDFNLGLELKLRRADIPVVHYVSPSVWAWRQKRIFKIAKATDLVLTLFPFEADFYEQHNVPVKFVGHPLADVIPLQIDNLAARQKLNLTPDATYIAILPGSRRNELKYLAETFFATAYQCWQQQPQLKFITATVNTAHQQQLQTLQQTKFPGLPITFFQNASHDVMAASDLVLVTSGTATLETMLHKRPMVIAYKMSDMTYAIAKRLIKLRYIGIPNLLANERLVPEFIQDTATPQQLSNALLNYLQHPEKIAFLEERFLQLHQQLRCNASQQAALAIEQVS